MYAIIETGGKQYRAEPHGLLQIESVEGGVGTIIEFDSQYDFSRQIRPPLLVPQRFLRHSVKGEIVRHARTRSITVFKMKRRKGYRRTRGHRQGFTQVRITEIVAP